MENEEKIKGVKGVKKARPFNNEKIKGLIPDPKVINPLRKKVPLFKK